MYCLISSSEQTSEIGVIWLILVNIDSGSENINNFPKGHRAFKGRNTIQIQV